ncbi:MAG: OmpA family protein [Bdellovibrionales bacterium]|nr:OmpA family protein [Bdellovibrionales bacterium]
MKFRLSGDDAFLNVAVMPYGAFPTGRIGNDAIRYLVTDDSFIYGAKILVDKKWGLFDTYVNLGYSRAENASFLNIDRTSRMDYAGGVFVPLLPNRKLGLMGEVLGAVTVPSFDKDQNPVEVHFGARAQWGTVRLYAGAGLEAFRKARSNDLSLFIGAKIPLGSKKEPKPFVEPEPEPKIETEPEPEVVELQRRIQILKEKLSVRREINFKTNEAVILPESYSELDSAAEIIAEHSNQIQAIVIEGHTDSQGKDAYNLKLSQRRAESVKQYMVDKGIDPAKLRAIGYGESRPKVEEVDSESRRINRRVEFTVEAEIEIEKEVIEETGQSLVPQELPKEVDPNSNELQSLDSQGVEADSDSVFEENPERGSDASEDLEWDDIQDENSEGEADELGF